MSSKSLSIVLALACAVLLWRECRRPAIRSKPTVVECERVLEASSGVSSERSRSRNQEDAAPDREPTQTAPSDGLSINGFRVPGWAMRLLPQAGENLLAYRDRIVPLAQLAVAPHRARVVRGRDDFANVANLTQPQRAELDAAVRDAARQIQDRVLGAALGGELSPQTFKPMTGVALARDVLEVVDKTNQRFLATLDEHQRAALATHPFDVGDYLVFSTRWEDALGYTE